MKISYTGSQDGLPSKQRDKFEAKLQKLSKMLERKGEREAHVIISKERFLNRVEITLNAFDHSMAGAGADGDLTTALNEALEKLEKQVIRMRSKWRDTKRHKDKEAILTSESEAAAPATGSRSRSQKQSKKAAEPVGRASAPKGSPRVFRVNHKDGRKPMTLEEAMLEVGTAEDYLVFHDAETDRMKVLLRRPDGNFDLIES